MSSFILYMFKEREKKTRKIRTIAKKKKRGNNTNFKILANITYRMK